MSGSLADAFRAEFPVLERVAYLNAGTVGPVPRRAAEAARRRLDHELLEGRAGERQWETLLSLTGSLRDAYARVLGCDPAELALTRSATEGCNIVLSALDLRPGEEILTSDEEHPGLLAPLNEARRRRGIRVRVAPFAELASEIRPQTRLVACSHVSWVSGRVADVEALAAAEPPLLLDGAQGIGAVPAQVRSLGCDFYAGSGQKWLCGPVASGCLYVRRQALDTLATPWPQYASVEEPARALDSPMRPDAQRLDTGTLASTSAAWSLAALELFFDYGLDWMHERGRTLAARLAERLRERGLEVAPRGASTLVSWRDADPAATVKRLAAEGIVVRSIPGFDVVRASVGAWSSEEELERLAALAGA